MISYIGIGRSLLRVLSLLLFMGIAAGEARAIQPTLPDVLKALESFNAGNQAGAIAAMDAALQTWRDDAVLRLTYGVVLANERRYDDAAKAFSVAAAALPGDPLPHLLAEGALTEAGDAAGAMKARKVADDILKNGEGKMALARSATMLQSALARYPKNAVALNLLGDVRQMLDDGGHAADAYREAASLAPWWVKPHFNLGMAYLPTNPNAAANSFARVLELDPKNLRACLWLGDAYVEQSRYADALKAYGRARGSKALASQAAIRMGNVYLKQGLSDKAKDEFQEATEASPQDPAAQAGLAEAYVQGGEYEEGAKQYAEAEKLVPPTAPKTAQVVVLDNLAKAYTGAGEYSRAIEKLKKIIELAPGFRNPYATLAGVYRRAGLLTSGIAEYQRKVQSPPVNPADALILAELQRVAGNITGAREAFQLALKWAKAEPFISCAKAGLESLGK